MIKNINWLKVGLFAFTFKILSGFGTPIDGFVLLVLTGLNVFFYFHDSIQKNREETAEIERKLKDRIEKLENVTSQLSLTQGFNRGK